MGRSATMSGPEVTRTRVASWRPSPASPLTYTVRRLPAGTSRERAGSAPSSWVKYSIWTEEVAVPGFCRHSHCWKPSPV